jgi:hypothetical protein
LHFTPTYSAWLNQVKPWFGKIERDVITREVLVHLRTTVHVRPQANLRSLSSVTGIGLK